MSCSENTLLKGVKDKQKELDTLLEQGKDGLASMQSKVDELKADLSSFVPVLPEVPSLQGDLLKLGDITSASGLATKIAELKASMGSAVPDLDSLISSLGLDSFPPTINSADICSTMPNVETIDGVATVVPAESKVPEEEPKKPEPKPVIEPDKDELNLRVITLALSNARRQIQEKTDALEFPNVPESHWFALRSIYSDLTFDETRVQLSELGGSTWDDLKWKSYNELEMSKKQAKQLNETGVIFGFHSEGKILEEMYTKAKSAKKEYADADDLATAAKLKVEQQKKKLG